MKTIKDIQFTLGLKVLMRADFNVPIINGIVADDYRIRMTIPTIEYLLNKEATVILISHIESNNGDNLSLEPVANHLNKLGVKVSFIKDYRNAHEMIEAENQGCFLLENLRFFEGEKKNDSKFAKELASLGDIYVNDAFSVCHREHASIVGVPKLSDSYAGLQLEKEIRHLSNAFNPTHPFLFILGGAKFETKIPLLEKFMNVADTVFVGGALASDFFKEKGYEVGQSRVSEGNFNLSQYANNSKLMIPVDITTRNKEIKNPESLSKEDKITDCGPKTLEILKEKISQAKLILWNGPLGVYEDGFKENTLELAKMIAEATINNGAQSIIGGGDTLAAVAELGIEDKFTFVSTGGGAMLDFLAKGTLPGIEALNN
ncbi:MAG: phosphoglycerate kinase [Nanoarchaeota archaeon]|nr:phosphoglycerate kinase [Nanoarchaeota archaeon]